MRSGWVLPREVEMAMWLTGLPGVEVYSYLSSPSDWMSRYVKKYRFINTAIGCRVKDSKEATWHAAVAWASVRSYTQLQYILCSMLLVFQLLVQAMLSHSAILIIVDVFWMNAKLNVDTSFVVDLDTTTIFVWQTGFSGFTLRFCQGPTQHLSN